MKKILFNFWGLQLCCKSKFHGAGEYGKTVLKYLIENHKNEVEIFFVYNKNLYIDDWIVPFIQKNKISILNVRDREEFVKTVNQEKINIIYSPCRLDYRVKPDLNENIIIRETIHDIRGIELVSDFFSIKYMKPQMMMKNILKVIFSKWYLKYQKKIAYNNMKIIDCIICVSNHTKYSVLNFFPELQHKEFKVFYTPSKLISRGRKEGKGIQKYILVLGGDRWIKNVARAVLALDDIFKIKEYSTYKAVIIGKIPQKLMRQITNKDNFLVEDYVEEYVLEQYYADCVLFLYPSLCEGFGMPPLEAMRYNKTCVISGTSSLPEIYGDAAYYVNPYNLEEIKEKVIWAIQEPIEKNKIRTKFEQIQERQANDLKLLCQYIVS